MSRSHSSNSAKSKSLPSASSTPIETVSTWLNRSREPVLHTIMTTDQGSSESTNQVENEETVQGSEVILDTTWNESGLGLLASSDDSGNQANRSGSTAEVLSPDSNIPRNSSGSTNEELLPFREMLALEEDKDHSSESEKQRNPSPQESSCAVYQQQVIYAPLFLRTTEKPIIILPPSEITSSKSEIKLIDKGSSLLVCTDVSNVPLSTSLLSIEDKENSQNKTEKLGLQEKSISEGSKSSETRSSTWTEPLMISPRVTEIIEPVSSTSLSYDTMTLQSAEHHRNASVKECNKPQVRRKSSRRRKKNRKQTGRRSRPTFLTSSQSIQGTVAKPMIENTAECTSVSSTSEAVMQSPLQQWAPEFFSEDFNTTSTQADLDTCCQILEDAASSAQEPLPSLHTDDKKTESIDSLNLVLWALRSLVPNGKALQDKASILHATADYIEQLRNEIREHLQVLGIPDDQSFWESLQEEFRPRTKEHHKRSNKEKEGETVKRPPNAFIRFSVEFRRLVKHDFPERNNREISQMLGSIWRRMSEEEKEPYITKFYADLDEQRRQHPEWNYSKGSGEIHIDWKKIQPERLRPRQKQFSYREMFQRHYDHKSKKKIVKHKKSTVSDLWVQCDSCNKWRKLASNADLGQLPEKWTCQMNSDVMYNSCNVEEEKN